MVAGAECRRISTEISKLQHQLVPKSSLLESSDICQIPNTSFLFYALNFCKTFPAPHYKKKAFMDGFFLDGF
jgi:hypothetical protein